LRLAGFVKAVNSLPLDRNFEISMPRINSTDTRPYRRSVPTQSSWISVNSLCAGRSRACGAVALTRRNWNHGDRVDAEVRQVVGNLLLDVAEARGVISFLNFMTLMWINAREIIRFQY
jgi:hypothetical protein